MANTYYRIEGINENLETEYVGIAETYEDARGLYVAIKREYFMAFASKCEDVELFSEEEDEMICDENVYYHNGEFVTY